MLSEKRWQPIQVLMLGMLVFMSVLGGALASGIVGHFVHPYINTDNRALLTLVITVIGFQGAAMVWVHFFLLKHEVSWGEGFGFAQHNYVQCFAVALIALPVVLGGMYLLGGASDWALRALYEQLQWKWLKPDELQPAVQLLQKKWPAYLLAVQGLVAIVVAPVAEEVLFRGILYTTIKQHGHGFAALWVTAVLFAGIHFYPVGFLSLIFLAVVLVALYEWTRNLLAPILLHAMFNAVNFALIVSHPKWADQIFKT